MARNTPPLLGRTLGGAYRLTGLIGSGATGQVYAAEVSDGPRAAVKVLKPHAALDRDMVARFEREATIAATITSPYVAAVLGAGRDEGHLWIAFELLSGEGLDVRLRREGYLSFHELAPIVDDVLLGLVDAHRAGVVHRDIKPANLFVETLGAAERTRILDFGVSKLGPHAASSGEPSLTACDATLGSFAYMAPEQVRASARVDGRADLYALGAVAFRALTGRLPFEGSTPEIVTALKLDRDPPRLSEVTGDRWPSAIESFLSRMMARDRERRFETAGVAVASWRDVRAQMGAPPQFARRAVDGPHDALAAREIPATADTLRESYG
jgi:serine/threonine-protein kinase